MFMFMVDFVINLFRILKKKITNKEVIYVMGFNGKKYINKY